MKRIDVVAVGLSASDQLLIGAFLDLIALADGHVFRLCEHLNAPIVIYNPADSNAAELLNDPKRGVAYIQYGVPDQSFGPHLWCLGMPVRLGPLREIMSGIVERRREWTTGGGFVQAASSSPSPNPSPATQPVLAHRKLEQVLGVLECVVKSRIPHLFNGIPGVEIEVFPQTNLVYIRREAGTDCWQKALADSAQPVTAFAHIGAKPTADTQPITVAQFRWELARHLSAGMLLPGIAAKQEFGLIRWPDFGAMSAGAFDLRIVALIATRQASIASMLRTVPYTREGVIALLNGCALVGCMGDAPEDLLLSADAQKPSADMQKLSPDMQKLNADTQKPMRALFANRVAPGENQTVATAASQTPQRGFSGMLSKLRAALSFVSRENL